MSANGDSENDGENDSFIENNIYCTQNAEEVETEIYEEIKNQFGHYDKENFLSNLVERYVENPEQLNEIRQSMYDYAKANIEEFPHGFLTERRQRGTGKSITEKYASDVYYIYAFVEGVVSTTEFQREVMSRHKMKHSLLQETPINNTTSNEETNDNMTSMKKQKKTP